MQPDGEHVHLNVRIEPANKTCEQIMQRTGSYRSELKHVHILNYNFFFLTCKKFTRNKLFLLSIISETGDVGNAKFLLDE